MGNPTLITGGCGFVGRHLVAKLLAQGKSLWIIDNLFIGKHPDQWLGAEWQKRQDGAKEIYEKGGQTITFLKRDVRDVFRAAVEKSSADVGLPDFEDVYHLASIVGGRMLIDGDPLLVSTDLAIDASLFLWATRFGQKLKRLMYASSSAAYPVHLQTDERAVALHEDHINFEDRMGVPDMTYGWSKLTGEYLSRLTHKRYGLHVACVRPFSGYGEDQDLDYPVPSIALRVARHDNPIEVWGTGEQGRDFVHIDDCIDAMFVVLDKIKDGRGINIGSGRLTSFNELIRVMLDLEGHQGRIQPLLDKPVGVQSRYAHTEFLNNEIGWKPAISLEKGMARVLAHAHKRLLDTNAI